MIKFDIARRAVTGSASGAISSRRGSPDRILDRHRQRLPQALTVREANKALGTRHVAFGDSQGPGRRGERPLVDMICDNPAGRLDDERVMKDGKILV